MLYILSCNDIELKNLNMGIRADMKCKQNTIISPKVARGGSGPGLGFLGFSARLLKKLKPNSTLKKLGFYK
jgi:hypothetical protein